MGTNVIDGTVERMRRRQESLEAAREQVAKLPADQRVVLEYEFQRAELEARVIVEYGTSSQLSHT
jgi:L-rhamnose isomerase